MRSQGRTGRYNRKFEFGRWPWHIRPAGTGGSNLRIATATCSVSGSDTTPVGQSGYTDSYGTPVDITGEMPDLSKTTFTYSIVPMAIGHNQSTTYPGPSYYQQSDAIYKIVFYSDANKIIWSSGSDSLNIGNTQIYTKVNPFGGYKGATNDSSTVAFSPTQGYLGTQPWLIPPATAVTPNKVGLFVRATRVSCSLTAKVLIYWTKA